MKFVIPILFSFLGGALLVGCTLGMTPAFAPTAPPQIVSTKNAFDSQSLVGRYQSVGLVTMFLWPKDRVAADGDLVPLTFPEKADSRFQITTLADEIGRLKREQIYPVKMIEMEFKALAELESLFLKNQCYSLCDPEDFFSCNPANECNLKNSTWKTPQDSIEEATIVACQTNQQKREELELEKKAALAKAVGALAEAEQKASFSLLKLIDRDRFATMESLSIGFDPSLPLDEQIMVDVTFKNAQYSNHRQALAADVYTVKDILFDRSAGYLTFAIDASPIQAPDPDASGDLLFDLELKFEGGFMTVDGNIVLQTSQGDRIGRISSAGPVLPPGYVPPKCQ